MCIEGDFSLSTNKIESGFYLEKNADSGQTQKGREAVPKCIYGSILARTQKLTQK